MAYKRVTVPREIPSGEDLTRAMAGIGMRFATDPLANPNIEDTLLAASVEAMGHGDLRVLSVLVTWLRVHHPWVNADRLTRAVSGQTSPRIRAFWSATAAWLGKDRRFARMAKFYQGQRVDVLPVGTEFQIARSGEDPRFEGTPLRVPAGALRDRSSDVLEPAELARIHRAYHQRVLMGPTYRADMWAALEAEPSLSASGLARQTYGSFATAWQVKGDFRILAA
jgi:hypothetical protein